MKLFQVTLSRKIVQEAEMEIHANSEEEARRKAIVLNDVDEIDWEQSEEESGSLAILVKEI